MSEKRVERDFLGEFEGPKIVVEPLSFFPVLKDLKKISKRISVDLTKYKQR